MYDPTQQMDKVKFNSRAGAEQVIDFSDMPCGGTDIDLLIEWRNQAFVFAEAKYKDTKIPSGQLKALERLTDTAQRAGKRSICFIVSHNIKPPGDIEIGYAIVTNFRFMYKWQQPRSKIMLKDAVKGFLNKL